MTRFRTSLGFWLAGMAVALLPALAAAQDFPSKPIKLIVPFPAGGPNDIIARAVGQKMADILKQPVLVDNRGGQGGVGWAMAETGTRYEPADEVELAAMVGAAARTETPLAIEGGGTLRGLGRPVQLLLR